MVEKISKDVASGKFGPFAAFRMSRSSLLRRACMEGLLVLEAQALEAQTLDEDNPT